MRFERGISPELTLPALQRARQLLAELGGGKAAVGVVDVYPGKLETKPISLSTGEVKRLLGVEFSLEQIVAALTSLGFECQTTASGSEVLVTAPYWRSDIHLAVDLIEEVARVVGYDSLPMTMLSQPIPRQNSAPIIRLKPEIRHHLTGYGFQELITYSMTSLALLNKLSPVPYALTPMPLRVANPMTPEQEYLRPNLRANLLLALAANRRREEGGIRLFELGRVYIPRNNDLPEERETLCGILSGPLVEKSWLGEGKPPDFFEAKGIVEGLLHQLGVSASFQPSSDGSLNSTERAEIHAAPRDIIEAAIDKLSEGKITRLGALGKLQPKVLENFEITGAVYLLEIDLPKLLPFTLGHKMFQPIPRFPSVVRDMALVVDAGIAHQKIVDIIKGFPLIEAVAIFDVYSGGQVPRGKKSLAYRITFQSPATTLIDDEVNEVQQQILDKLLKELGATLRG